MRKILSVGLALLVVSLVGMGIVGAIAAQGPETATPGAGLQGMWGRVRLGAGVAHEVVLELLGLSEDELHAAREDGQTLAEIATQQGVSEDELLGAIVAAKAEAIEAAVAEGTLTEEQAERMLERAVSMAELQITRETGQGRVGQGRMGEGAGGGRMGRGMRGGQFGGQRGGYDGDCPFAGETEDTSL